MTPQYNVILSKLAESKFDKLVVPEQIDFRFSYKIKQLVAAEV